MLIGQPQIEGAQPGNVYRLGLVPTYYRVYGADVNASALSLHTTGAIIDTVSGASAGSIIPFTSVSRSSSPAPRGRGDRRVGEFRPTVGGHELSPVP
jgi:hypothetical protein